MEKPKIEQQKTENIAETIERKRPGGAVPEYSLWEPRIEIGKDGQKKETGVRAPDGTYYKLEEGERFVINKEEKGDYEAVIIGPDGEEKILRKSFAREKAESEKRDEGKLAEIRKNLGREQQRTTDIAQEQPEKNLNNEQTNLLKKLDRGLLRKIVEETTGVQEVRYGKEFNLDNDKREQLRTAAQIVKNFLESKKQDSRWTKFQKLMEEGQKRGLIMDFKFPPAWLVDGGKDAEVQKIKLADGRAGIQVPSEIYNLYYWDARADELSEEAETSDNMLKGRSAKHLNKNLVELSGFFKESGLIK